MIIDVPTFCIIDVTRISFSFDFGLTWTSYSEGVISFLRSFVMYFFDVHRLL